MMITIRCCSLIMSVPYRGGGGRAKLIFTDMGRVGVGEKLTYWHYVRGGGQQLPEVCILAINQPKTTTTFNNVCQSKWLIFNLNQLKYCHYSLWNSKSRQKYVIYSLYIAFINDFWLTWGGWGLKMAQNWLTS